MQLRTSHQQGDSQRCSVVENLAHQAMAQPDRLAILHVLRKDSEYCAVLVALKSVFQMNDAKSTDVPIARARLLD